MGILTHLVRIRKGSESGFSRLQITADSWKVPNSSPAKLEHKWLHVLHEAGDTGQQLCRLSADGHVEVEMCEPPRLSTYKWTAISPDPLITRILWLGVGRQSRPRKGAPENSDPWFPSINGVPRSVFDDWCPKGEGAKLLAGSKEIGSYKKGYPLCTLLPPGMPLPVRISEEASVAVLQLQKRSLPTQMEDGRRHKINPRRDSEVSIKPGVLIKPLA